MVKKKKLYIYTNIFANAHTKYSCDTIVSYKSVTHILV